MAGRPAALSAVLILAVVAACTSGSGGSSAPTSSVVEASSPLPPGTLAELAPVIDPLVRPLDLRLARGSLVDRSTGGPGPRARHLALYVEPTTAFSDERFVANIAPLAAAVTPFVFARWPDLESYDICQEPSPGVDDRPEPETVTVFEVSRDYAGGLDWRQAELSRLVRDTANRRPGVLVAVTARLRSALDSAAR